MKASINLCVKKVSYTTLQKPNPSAHYKTYSILLYNEDNASNYVGNLWCWSQKQTSEKKCQPYWSIILCFYMKINILSCSASDLKCPSNLVKKKKRKASRKSIFPKKHVKEHFQSIGRNSTIPIPQTSVGATCQKYCASC